jgi:hypothetical protein
MQTNDWLYRVPLLFILLGLFVAMVVTWILGRAIGEHHRQQFDEEARSHASGLHGAMLGLLALLLGFTFSMAVQRFETNRDMVSHEASAIETAYLRADIADEPERLALKGLLRRYIDTRVTLYQAKIDQPKRAAINAETRRLQAEIWRHAMTTAARAPNSTMAALLVEAVNRVIDIYELRLHAVRNTVPPTILWLLILMSVAATALTGYVAGFGNKRHPAPTALVIALIALVILVIVDLDRPTRGFIRSGQGPMLELQHEMHEQITASP